MPPEGHDLGNRRRLKNIAVLVPILVFTLVGIAVFVLSPGEDATLTGSASIPGVVWPICAGTALFVVLVIYLSRTRRFLLAGNRTPVQLMGRRNVQLVVVAWVASFFLLKALGTHYPTAKTWVMIFGLTFLALCLSLELCVNILRLMGVLPPGGGAERRAGKDAL